MAMQSIDFKKAKHSKVTTARVVPALINRTNKRTARELMPLHLANHPRMGPIWQRWNYFD